MLLQMAGVVPSPLLLELLSCPHCARALETMDVELGDSDYSSSEGDVVYEFSHGAEFKPCRASHHKILEERNCLAQYWDDFRDRLKRIVDSKYFNRGIMIAILINTLSMGIEYHEQVSASVASFMNSLIFHNSPCVFHLLLSDRTYITLILIGGQEKQKDGCYNDCLYGNKAMKQTIS